MTLFFLLSCRQVASHFRPSPHREKNERMDGQMLWSINNIWEAVDIFRIITFSLN